MSRWMGPRRPDTGTVPAPRAPVQRRTPNAASPLGLSAVDGPAERDADRLAAAAMAREDAPPLATAHAAATPQPAPASVRETIAGSGQPLPAGVRTDMEAGFGRDFGSVRLHAGTAAERSARDIDAAAYAVGTDIAFAAGRFAPASAEGRRLIAHELGHVVQQQATGAARVMREPASRPAPTMGTMPKGPARPATAEDRRDVVREAIRFLQGQADFFALQRDRDTAKVLGHLRTTASNALTTIEGDTGATALADQLRTTYSAAVRTVLTSRTVATPAAGQTPPTLQELFEQHRDDILPFALPQASVDTGAAELSAELEAPLPDRPSAAQRARHTAIQTARQRLRVVTAPVTTSIEDLFSTRGGTTTIPLPANTTARFSSTIPATLQRGLQSLAAQLMDTPLAANTTVQLALDLTPFGGSYDTYRFTRLDLGTLGTEVLIERQGAIGIEGLTTEQRTALRERFDTAGFRGASNFGQDEFDQVLIGIGELPQAQLSSLSGMSFERASADATHPDTAAHYDQAAHTVRVFDRAFSGGMTRLGRAGRPLQFAAHAVAHEVGHALDLGPLRTTAAATEAAQQALLAEFGTGGTSFTVPGRGAPGRARFDQLNSDVTAAATAERAARARSGARWSGGNPSEVTDALAARARRPAFRAAALRDGGGTARMPTDYPDPESIWQEYFADSYSMYQTSPDLLRRNRPNVFAFMEQEFPR